MRTTALSLLAIVVLAGLTKLSQRHETKNQAMIKGEDAPIAGINARDSCCVSESPKAGVKDSSVYQLESRWINQNGKEMCLSQLQGKTCVFAMFYSHCTYACPITINDMKKIETALPFDLNERIGFVLVSFDPVHDSPETLKKLAESQELDRRRWTLLTGRDYDDRTLAAMLGVEFKKKGNGDFMHSSQITVLNPAGEIVYKHVGLNRPISDVVEAIENCSAQQ